MSTDPRLLAEFAPYVGLSSWRRSSDTYYYAWNVLRPKCTCSWAWPELVGTGIMLSRTPGSRHDDSRGVSRAAPSSSPGPPSPTTWMPITSTSHCERGGRGSARRASAAFKFSEQDDESGPYDCRVTSATSLRSGVPPAARSRHARFRDIAYSQTPASHLGGAFSCLFSSRPCSWEPFPGANYYPARYGAGRASRLFGSSVLLTPSPSASHLGNPRSIIATVSETRAHGRGTIAVSTRLVSRRHRGQHLILTRT